MNPQEQFCPNGECLARGKLGEGNVGVHSVKGVLFLDRSGGFIFDTLGGFSLRGHALPPFLKGWVVLLHGDA
jgi:hypothetical protein